MTQTSRRFGIADDASRIATSIISRNLSPNPKQAKKDDAKLAAPAKDKKAVVSIVVTVIRSVSLLSYMCYPYC